MTIRKIEKYVAMGIITILLGASSIWYVSSPIAEPPHTIAATESNKEEHPLYEGNHIVVNLKDMHIELRNGTTTLHTMNILTIGKPDSYYETIGGAYPNDYSIREHFSSIGHVYMPWSVHVYGNFFIHGIPHYENGTEVSSEYSGGCIRLSNKDAEAVYNFVARGTPIVVTEHLDTDFIPMATTTPTLESIEMTRFMVATVSLEVLTQDTQIKDIDGLSTTRRKLLPRLILNNDDSVSTMYATARGEATFVDYMNQKARALGLTNTSFTSVLAPAQTIHEEQQRFMNYIATYKTYLLELASSTEVISH